MILVECNRLGRQESYHLVFSYDYNLVQKIKEISSEFREFDPTTKLWTLKAKGLSLLIAKYKGKTDEIKFQFEDDKQRQQFLNILQKIRNKEADDKLKAIALEQHNKEVLEMKTNLPELAKTIDYTQYLKDGVIPMPHQLEGAYFVNYLESSILALVPGLGKTLCVILACLMDDTCKQVLVVAPANLKINWLKEVEMFTNSTAYIIKYQKGKLTKYRRNKGRKLEECKFVITNYEYFQGKTFNLDAKITDIGLNPDVVIFDESHRLSNKKAQSTDNIKRGLQDRVKRKILLTGTPIRNKLTQLFFALKMVKPEEFSNESKFFTEYCGLKWDKDARDWVLDPNNPPKLKELNQKLNTFMFRLKNDVMKDLPELYLNKIYLEMSPEEEKQYKEIEEGLAKVDWSNFSIAQTTEEDNTSAVVIISRLRQFTSKIKNKYIRDIIEELNDTDEKVIVFDVFKKPLHELKLSLGENSEVYDGDISGERKEYLKEQFQDKNSKLKNLLISMEAGNAGITLTASNRVFLISQAYTVSSNEQAYARSHRKGQLRDVYGSTLIIADTIDEIIDEALIEKRKVIDAVVDGEDFVDTATVSVFGDVLKELKDRYTK